MLDGPALAAITIFFEATRPATAFGRAGIAIGASLLAWSAWLLCDAALKRRERPRAR